MLLAFQVEGSQQTYNIKIYGCIVDCPALKLMANINGRTGYFSCYYCHIKGVHIRKPGKRQYRYTPTINYRTVNSFYINSREAQQHNRKLTKKKRCHTELFFGTILRTFLGSKN